MAEIQNKLNKYKKNKHVKLRGAAYVKFAKEVLERDDWQCVVCGNTKI